MAEPPCGRHRLLRADDLIELARLESEGQINPWSPTSLQSYLEAHYRCVVWEEQNKLLGYGALSVASDEGEIINLLVAPGFRQHGGGRALLSSLLDQARLEGVQSVFLEVRRSNRAARVLYRQSGFQDAGVRRDYYRTESGREDAVCMRLML